jgi:hypothetical protein
MATKIFEENGVMTLGSIASDQDVQLGNNIHINPPSHDRRCWCCGRPISQLKPFGKAGDPLVGDFDGVYLVKKGRRDGPYDEGATSAVERAEARYSEEGFKDPLDWLIREYGETKGKELYCKAELYWSIGKSWECRDCAVLDEDEYFERLNQRRREEKEKSTRT